MEEPLKTLPDGRAVHEVWIAVRTDGVKGSGTENDPYDGSTAAKFDALMQELPENMTVHLGPGTFETEGYNEVTGWQPKSGQKILGSGIGVTILKLVNASIAGQGRNTAIGVSYSTFLTSFEAADFTVDCNLGGQTIPGYDFAPVACHAISILGTHIRIRRVRAINFGTQSTPATPLECFVFVVGTVDPNNEASDCAIENCIVEQPSLNNTDITTCILLIAQERSSDGVMPFHRGCVVRNCVVDCEYRVNPVRITEITFSGTTATVTTQRAHGRSVDDWIRIAGALVNGSADNPFNGSFKITSATSSTFQYTMVSTPAAQPVGEIWVDKFSSQYVPINQITRSGAGSNWTVRITTTTPHFRVPGNNVAVHGAAPSGYNGVFKVTNVPSNPLELEYRLSSDPGQPVVGSAFIGTLFQAMTGDGGTAAVIEGNRIFNTRVSVYHAYWSSKDLIIRNNHFRAVVNGPFNNLGVGAGVGGSYLLASLTYAQENGVYVATAQSSYQQHGLAVGDAVLISQASRPEYNGYFTIIAVVPAVPGSSNEKFKYVLPADPGGDSTSGYFARFWQVGRLVIENNIIELVPTPTNYGPPYGVLLGYAGFAEPPRYRQVVIRGNVIRHVDGTTDPPGMNQATGIAVQGCRELIVEDNVVDLEHPSSIQYYLCGTAKFFNNRTSAAALVQGYDSGTSKKASELPTDIEDASLLAL